MGDMETAIKQLQETAIVMAGIQERQAKVLKGHGEWLEQQQMLVAGHEQWLAKHEAAMARHDQVMREIDDKLNGLIGVVDDFIRKPRRE